jgi:hypothetical protein
MPSCLVKIFFFPGRYVLDNNGKLIIAEYRKGIQNYWRSDFTSDNDHHYHDSSYRFHLDYLVPAIKKGGICSPLQEFVSHYSGMQALAQMFEVYKFPIQVIGTQNSKTKNASQFHWRRS